MPDLPVGTLILLPNVVFEGVNPDLIAFITHLAMIHRLVFGRPLIVTSGKDGAHASSSLHPQGLAVDVRSRDKDLSEISLFIHVLAYAVDGQPVAYFDERQLPGEPHIHIEWHGK